MRHLMLVLTTTILMGCAAKEAAPPETVAEPPAPVAAAPIDLAAVAGTWEMRTMGASSDSVLTTFTLEASADTAGWLMAFPKRMPMKLNITVSGDSVMSVSPEYESVLRKGAKVQTNTVFHLVGDKLIGRTTAHYTGAGPDSVVQLRSEGTRAPK